MGLGLSLVWSGLLLSGLLLRIMMMLSRLLRVLLCAVEHGLGSRCLLLLLPGSPDGQRPLPVCLCPLPLLGRQLQVVR